MIEEDPGSDGRVRSELVLSNVVGAGAETKRANAAR